MMSEDDAETHATIILYKRTCLEQPFGQELGPESSLTPIENWGQSHPRPGDKSLTPIERRQRNVSERTIAVFGLLHDHTHGFDRNLRRRSSDAGPGSA